jgi:hypothetical protein
VRHRTTILATLLAGSGAACSHNAGGPTDMVEPAAARDGSGLRDSGQAARDSGARLDAPADAKADTHSSSAPCADGDPERVFYNDFEDGRFYATSDAGTDPSSDWNVTDPTRFAVVGKSVMANTHDGDRVLRGNFWEWNYADGGMVPAYDPPALAAGILIRGAKSVPWHIDLTTLGISQTPSADPTSPPPPAAEVYVSFWLWFDADFSHDSTTGTQAIKLFYAFGPNGVEWVTTDEPHLFFNMNLGAWPLYPWGTLPHAFEGRWSHIEWYFRSESRPVYYEYGPFSDGMYLASKCPGVIDYTMVFPVPGSSPVECLTPAQALAMNSQDGAYTMKVDGAVVYQLETMPYNGRFDQMNFPAYHGGGGEPIASAGWAVDDVCIRTAAPPGFL